MLFAISSTVIASDFSSNLEFDELHEKGQLVYCSFLFLPCALSRSRSFMISLRPLNKGTFIGHPSFLSLYLLDCHYPFTRLLNPSRKHLDNLFRDIPCKFLDLISSSVRISWGNVMLLILSFFLHRQSRLLHLLGHCLLSGGWTYSTAAARLPAQVRRFVFDIPNVCLQCRCSVILLDQYSRSKECLEPLWIYFHCIFPFIQYRPQFGFNWILPVIWMFHEWRVCRTCLLLRKKLVVLRYFAHHNGYRLLLE